MADLGTLSNQLLQRILAGEPPYDVSPEAREEFWQKGILTPVKREFEEWALPDLKRRYSHAFWGSEANKALNKAYRDLLDTLAGARSKLMYQEELGTRAAKERALERGMRGTEMATGLMSQLAQLGAVQRALQDTALMREYEEWLRTRPEYSPWLQMAPTFLSITPYTQMPIYTTPKVHGMGIGGILGNILGTAGGLGLGGFLSKGLSSLAKKIF